MMTRILGEAPGDFDKAKAVLKELKVKGFMMQVRRRIQMPEGISLQHFSPEMEQSYSRSRSHHVNFVNYEEKTVKELRDLIREKMGVTRMPKGEGISYLSCH